MTLQYLKFDFHMEKKRIFSGSSFEAVAGYSRAVVDGDWIHVKVKL